MKTKEFEPESKEWADFVALHADAYTVFDSENWTVFYDVPINNTAE